MISFFVAVLLARQGDDALSLYIKASALYKNKAVVAKLGWSLTMPPKISPALDKALTRDARVLSLVRRAAHMPHNFPALKFKKGMEIAEDARDRRNTRVKDLARLLTSSGVSYLSHGRKHEAVNEYLAAFEMGSHFLREAEDLSDSLSGQSIQWIVLRQIERAIPYLDPSDFGHMSDEFLALGTKSAWFEEVLHPQLAAMETDMIRTAPRPRHVCKVTSLINRDGFETLSQAIPFSRIQYLARS